jgi:hypothetical protein
MGVKQIDSQHPRFATFKSLSLANAGMPCLIADKQGNRLTLETNVCVPPFSPATVEYDDAMFLGEVVTSREENGGFTLEIKIEQVLSGLGSLMALRSHLLADSVAHPASSSPVAYRQQSPVLTGATR